MTTESWICVPETSSTRDGLTTSGGGPANTETAPSASIVARAAHVRRAAAIIARSLHHCVGRVGFAS